jgi:hypothetical protein
MTGECNDVDTSEDQQLGLTIRFRKEDRVFLHATVTDTCPHASATGASFFIMRALHLSVVANLEITYYHPTEISVKIVESTSQPNTKLLDNRF